MKSLYFECSSGIAGDMAVASLLDLGADVDVLNRVLGSVPLTHFKTKISRVNKSGIDCADFSVILDEDNHDHDMEYLFGKGHEHHHEHHNEEHTHEHHHEHRGLKEVNDIINNTKMEESARELALKMFRILADAEGKAHGISPEEVHFHEVGAVDSIVDAIALAVCYENLRKTNDIKAVYVPKVFEGSGTVRCQHGLLPIPVPAVANIAAAYNLNLSLNEDKGEFITPTGAAFLAAVKTDQKLPGEFNICKVGLGAGKRAYERPNFLRTFLIEVADESYNQGTVLKLETNVDDCSGEALGFVMEKLFAAGAYDVHYVPCFMKKNRPGWYLNVLCSEEKRPVLEEIIFTNTTTIGIRRTEMERTVLRRELITVETEFGPMRAKKVFIGKNERIYPEYEDVAKIAKEKNLPFETVFLSVKNTK